MNDARALIVCALGLARHFLGRHRRGIIGGVGGTPVSAQVTTAFSISVSVRFDGEQQRAQRQLLSGDRVYMCDHAVDRRQNGILHFHRFDRGESLSATHLIARFRLDRDDDAADRRANRAVRGIVSSCGGAKVRSTKQRTAPSKSSQRTSPSRAYAAALMTPSREKRTSVSFRDTSRIASASPPIVAIHSPPCRRTVAANSAPSTERRKGEARQPALGAGGPPRSTNRSAAIAFAAALRGDASSCPAAAKKSVVAFPSMNSCRRSTSRRRSRLVVTPATNVASMALTSRRRGFLAVGAETDNLGEQEIVEGRHHRAALDAAIDPHPLPFWGSPCGDASGRGQVIGRGILGVEPRLDRMATKATPD